ncbi:MAG: hypothetical protein JNM60_09625 [Candidatus Competibacteraceae bacterium]|nr:hypothetical protein [Candidatus Competibacteraceae bacterium]
MLHSLTRGLRLCVEDCCQLETADDDGTFVVAEGGLMTPLQLSGLRARLDEPAFERFVSDIAIALTPAMTSAAHTVQVVLERDPERTARELVRLLAPGRRALERLGLALDSLVDDLERRLLATCAFESVHVAVWTHPTALTKPERVKARKAYLASFKNRTPSHPPLEGQNPGAVFMSLREVHAATVATLVRDFNTRGIFVQPLSCHEFLHQLRVSHEPLTTPGWRAILPGDKPPMRVYPRAYDLSHVWYPRIGYQLCESAFERPLAAGVVPVGQRFMASAYMEFGPQQVRPFAQLFAQLDRDLPARIAFQLDGGFTHWRWGVRRLLADFWAFTSQYNKLISRAFAQIQEVQSREPTPRLRVCATTWAADEMAARARVARLRAALETWGAQQWQVERGDLAAGVLASLPGMAMDLTPGEPHAAPVSEAVRMLPLTRPTLPWPEGNIVFRTEDGKLMPYQPGSPLQPYWITLIAGALGGGKTLLALHDCLAFLMGGEREVPYLSLIEPGPSARGLIETLRAAVPENRAHLFVYRRLRQSPLDAINFLDLQLGMRDLLPYEKAFARNMLTALATPVGATQAPAGAAEIAAEVVKWIYPFYADDAHGHPKLYEPHRDHRIDLALAERGVKADSKTPWFAVVDRLFAAGDTLNAQRANRFAAPLLGDCINFLAHSDNIRQTWGRVPVAKDDLLIDFMIRQWTHAITVFPLLSAPTAVDLSTARVIALDIEEIATRGGQFSAWEASIAYLLVHRLAVAHFYLHEDNVSEWPPLYRDHQRQRILELQSRHKRAFFDEVHRMRGGAQATMQQLAMDGLESRKHGVEIVLASPLYDHFPDELVKNASTRMILGASEEEANALAERFSLSGAERQLIRRYLHGPTPEGTPLLLSVDTHQGRFTQLVYLSLGAEELWALSTKKEDRALRGLVMRHLPAPEARRRLVERFPEGSCVREYDARAARLATERGGLLGDDEQRLLIEQLASEIVAPR